MDQSIKPLTPAPIMAHARLAATLQAQRKADVVEPIHAELEPVQAYVEHIGKVTGKAHRVVYIPDNSMAYTMGYRYVSIPDDELDYYLAHGASLVPTT